MDHKTQLMLLKLGEFKCWCGADLRAIKILGIKNNYAYIEVEQFNIDKWDGNQGVVYDLKNECVLSPGTIMINYLVNLYEEGSIPGF